MIAESRIQHFNWRPMILSNNFPRTHNKDIDLISSIEGKEVDFERQIILAFLTKSGKQEVTRNELNKMVRIEIKLSILFDVLYKIER